MREKRIGAAAWGFRGLGLEEQLLLCKKLGFCTLELGIANVLGDISADAGESEIEHVKALYRKYGMPLLCGATGNDFTMEDVRELEEQKEKLKKVIDVCRRLEIPAVRIFAGFAHCEVVLGERWDRMIAALNECADYARQHEVTLAVETHGGVEPYGSGVRHFMSVSTEPALLTRLLREMRREIEIVYDPANLYAAGIREPWRIYDMIKGRTAYIHLKDFASLPDGSHRPGAMGEGTVDWEMCMEACRDFHGLYLIEYENPEDLEEGCRKSVDFINHIGL